jgi:hypothetical protein
MIWFAGICCVPRACLKRDRTTTILVNDVNIISIAGARDNIVRANNNCKSVANLPGSSRPSSTVKFNGGIDKD